MSDDAVLVQSIQARLHLEVSLQLASPQWTAGVKVEEVSLNEYGTFEDAYKNIWRFIEKMYNKKRLHSALGYRSPEQFEVKVALNTVA